MNCKTYGLVVEAFVAYFEVPYHIRNLRDVADTATSYIGLVGCCYIMDPASSYSVRRAVIRGFTESQ